jgi:hypothetical protein
MEVAVNGGFAMVNAHVKHVKLLLLILRMVWVIILEFFRRKLKAALLP